MPFRMRCPKCGGRAFNITRDSRTYSQMDETFQLVFSCRCGKQLFGQMVVDEYENQKAEYESQQAAKDQSASDRERAARERAERKKQEALREAYAYRASYIQQQRLELAEAERRRPGEGLAPLPPAPTPATPRATPSEAPPRPAVAAKAAAPAAPAAKKAEAAPKAPAGEKGADICAWDGCVNKRRPRSKYCSRACSNKNARARYKSRKVD